MSMTEDPRIVGGMQAQTEMLRQRIANGDRLIGWKVGFGAPAMLELLKIDGPLIGFLTEKAHVAPGGSVSFAGWTKPVIEPEIAVFIGRDVPAGASREDAQAAIAGVAPAIEVVDFNEPPTDPARILGHNIYQRHVVLGAGGPARPGGSAEGLTCRIIRRGVETARTTDPQTNTGEWIAIVQHVANLLAAFGERLRAGEFIITGSVVPPITVEPDEESTTFAVDPVGSVSVRFAWS